MNQRYICPYVLPLEIMLILTISNKSHNFVVFWTKAWKLRNNFCFVERVEPKLSTIPFYLLILLFGRRKSRSFGKSRFSKEVGQVTWKLGKTVLSPNVNRMDECSDIRLQTITAEKTEMIEHIKSTTNQRQNRVTSRDSDMSHHHHQALPSEYSVKLPKRKFLLFTTRLIRLMHVASICIVRLAYWIRRFTYLQMHKSGLAQYARLCRNRKYQTPTTTATTTAVIIINIRPNTHTPKTTKAAHSHVPTVNRGCTVNEKDEKNKNAKTTTTTTAATNYVGNT